MRRRTVLLLASAAVAAGAVAPAFASQPIPVGVSHDSNGGVCVSAFSWVPQCTDRIVPPAATR